MSEVGFIGIGVMGMPMARNVMRGGHQVRAFDIDEGALTTISEKGAEVATSARQAAEGAEFVITMLPTGDHVAAAVLGSDGAAEGLGQDAILIDMSTGLPATFDKTAQEVESQGRVVIDAPVGRTSKNAEDGTLLIMVGGAAEVVELVHPLLACMGDTIIHCGARGAGIRTKLVNNYLSIVSNVLVAETLAIAEGAGLDRDTVIEVLMGTTAGQGHLGTTYPTKVLAGDLEPGFMVDLARKDLGLALRMSTDSDTSHVLGTAAQPFYDAAHDRGMGRRDWTAMYHLVRELGGR